MDVPKHRLVLLLILLSLTASRPVHFEQANCNGFDFTAETTQGASQNQYKVTITASGGRQPYHYLLFDSKNNPMSKDFSKRIFEGLQAGRYRCIVTDSRDCNKERFIEVK